MYLFTAPAAADGGGDSRVELHLPLRPDHPSVPSLARLSFPAGRFEREMRDLFGIVPDDHPRPRRLVRHLHWPRGWYPMLTDAGDPPAFGDQDGPFPFRAVEGAGVYEIPVGPVHAGLIEPGHFRFSVVGETILNLKARLWYVHKASRSSSRAAAPARQSSWPPRVSGDTAVGHTLAYCRAVEDALAVGVPERRAPTACGSAGAGTALQPRRPTSARYATTSATASCNAHAQRHREQLLRMNDRVTGHRLLRGAIRPGGVSIQSLPDPDELAELAADIRRASSTSPSPTAWCTNASPAPPS